MIIGFEEPAITPKAPSPLFPAPAQSLHWPRLWESWPLRFPQQLGTCLARALACFGATLRFNSVAPWASIIFTFGVGAAAEIDYCRYHLRERDYFL